MKCQLSQYFRCFPRKNASCISVQRILPQMIKNGANPNQDIEILVQRFDPLTLNYRVQRYQSNVLLMAASLNTCMDYIDQLISMGADPYKKGFAYLKKEQAFFYGNCLDLMNRIWYDFSIWTDSREWVIRVNYAFLVRVQRESKKYSDKFKTPSSLKNLCKTVILTELSAAKNYQPHSSGGLRGIKMVVDYVDELKVPKMLKYFLKE